MHKSLATLPPCWPSLMQFLHQMMIHLLQIFLGIAEVSNVWIILLTIPQQLWNQFLIAVPLFVTRAHIFFFLFNINLTVQWRNYYLAKFSTNYCILCYLPDGFKCWRARSIMLVIINSGMVNARQPYLSATGQKVKCNCCRLFKLQFLLVILIRFFFASR